jgi:hypothetical protein
LKCSALDLVTAAYSALIKSGVMPLPDEYISNNTFFWVKTLAIILRSTTGILSEKRFKCALRN